MICIEIMRNRLHHLIFYAFQPFLIWIRYFQKMMCNFVARTNWSNIKSNYFMHTTIVFNLPYDTNLTITITFINQVTLSRTFLLFSPGNYLHKSSAIFQINLYVFDIHTDIPNSTHKLHHVKWSAIFQNKPFTIPYGRINHLCCHWNKRMLTIVQNTFSSRHTWWLPLIDEKFVIDDSVAVSIHFFLDLDHCSKHLLQPLCLMASSCWWKVCHQQLGCHFNPFFLDLV